MAADPGMDVREVDEARERRRRRRRTAAAVGLAAAVLSGGAALAWYLTPPPLPATVAEAEALVESVRYQRLGEAAKRPYRDVIRERFGSLDRSVRRELTADNERLREEVRAARTQQMEAALQRWVLAPPEARDAALAELWTSLRGAGGPGGAGRPAGGRPRMDPERAARIRERIGGRIAEGSAQSGQLMGEMFRARREAGR